MDFMEEVKKKMGEAYSIVKDRIQKTSEDPFTYHLIKSMVFFALGIKLFYDIEKHATRQR